MEITADTDAQYREFDHYMGIYLEMRGELYIAYMAGYILVIAHFRLSQSQK